MKKTNLFILFSLLSFFAMAQEKKSFTLDDLLPGGRTYSQLQPKDLYTSWWGNRLVETDLDECREIDSQKGSKKTLFTLEQLNQWLGADEGKALVHSCYNVNFRQLPNGRKDLVAGISGGRHAAGPFRQLPESGLRERA